MTDDRGTIEFDELLWSWDTLFQLFLVAGMLLLFAPLATGALELVSVTSDLAVYGLAALAAVGATILVRAVKVSTSPKAEAGN